MMTDNIPAGARVIWTDPDGGHRKAGTVLNQTDDDTYFVVFEDGSEAGAYGHELEWEGASKAKADLETFADSLPPGPGREIIEKILADPYEAARAALHIAMLLGAAEDWDGGADYLEAVADDIGYTGTFNHPGDDDNTPVYRQLCDVAGMEYRRADYDESGLD